MLVMYDSITPANLPPGAPAYLGYVDGHWPTFATVRAMFPRAHVLDMAVFASSDATGCDVEAGDLAPAQVPAWVRRQQARGVRRPVVYASAGAMGGIMAALAGAGISRAEVRLLSAHYGAGSHTCGPASCGVAGCPPCDGTQWRDNAPGAGGSLVDESVLGDGFFDAPAPPKPRPVPRKKETGMILVQVDRSSVPAGSEWPGVFLFTSGGRLLHVTGPDANGVNNVEAYQAAGIPAPVSISWDEYLVRAGIS